ncbi:hypothetical protein JMJ35_001848 [Cladonia borealis]|uniref:Uncharacterized protein n=1 Tax=Cladonia borealis TaxID=184061 RepID=A0AA39R8X8_9LECA|nr:hypothetical protein JMJ35_001848 [Cladonia borealis]
MAVDPQADFVGDIEVNNDPPTKATLEKIANLPVLDANNKSHTFKSLYADNEDGPRRVFICFIRHFFCGNCQEYIRHLSASLPPSALPPRTTILIIGCGQPDLIPMYIRETSCAYPIYADPTRTLYQKLGMTQTLALGPKQPNYIQKSFLKLVVEGFFKEIFSGRKMLSGGAPRQVGGEFLFEGGRVGWCRRMRNTRDHAEIEEVRRVLGLDSGNEENGVPSEVAMTTATTAATTAATTERKRASMGGLGGLGKRFSERRQSWGGSRSRATIEKRNDKAGTPPPAMDGVKEEGATQDDALAKLEGRGGEGVAVDEKTGANAEVTGITNGMANGVAAA